MKKTFQIWLILCSIFALSDHLVAQVNSSPNTYIPNLIETRFLRDSLILDEKGFAFNSFTIRNTSSKKISFQINADLKDKIQAVSPIPKELTLDANETRTIPLRFSIANSGTISGVFEIPFMLTLNGDGRTVTNKFFLRIEKNTKWKASVDRSMIIFKGTENALTFNITIDNRGNAEELFDVEIEVPQELRLKGAEKKIPVAAGSSKRIEILIENKERSGTPILLSQATLNVLVKNVNAETRRYPVELIRLGSRYSENISSYNKLPLTVEMNLNNIANQNPFVYARLFGTVEMNEKEKLRLYYQTDNYFRNFTANSFIGYAEYTNDHFLMRVGSMQEFNMFQVDGIGLKLGFKNRINNISGFYVSGREQKNEVAGLTEVLHLGKKWSNTLKGLYFNDKVTGLKSALAENELGVAFSKYTQASLLAGYSFERTAKKITPDEQTGRHVGYTFDHNKGNLSIASQMRYYTDGYAGFNKGFQYQLHRLKYQYKKAFVQAIVDVNERSQTSFTENGLLNVFNQNSRSASLNLGWYSEKGSYSLGPGVIIQKQDSANSFEAKSTVANLNIFYSFSQKSIFSLVSQTGFTTLPAAFYSKPIFISSNFGSLSIGNAGIQYRVDHGPIYYYEVNNYITATDKLNTLRYQLSPYYDLNFPKINLLSRVQYTINREMINDLKDDFIFQQLQWKDQRSKWEFIYSGQYSLTDKARTFVNIAVRRQLNIPVMRNRKVQNATFTFFKDINNNGTYDQGDVVLKDMQLFLNKTMLLTDASGNVQITNTDDKTFDMDLTISNNTQGWIPLNGLKQTLTLTGKNAKQFIPFKKGKVLKGSLILIKDENSKLDFSVGNIRITAESSEGNKYTAITNEKGEFYFNVVSGNYLVSLPQIFDESFKPVEFVQQVDLINNETFNVTFEIRQKKRNINIKRN